MKKTRHVASASLSCASVDVIDSKARCFFFEREKKRNQSSNFTLQFHKKMSNLFLFMLLAEFSGWRFSAGHMLPRHPALG